MGVDEPLLGQFSAIFTYTFARLACGTIGGFCEKLSGGALHPLLADLTLRRGLRLAHVQVYAGQTPEKDVVPQSYDIQLKPDVEKLTFTGSEKSGAGGSQARKNDHLERQHGGDRLGEVTRNGDQSEQAAGIAIDAKVQIATLSLIKEIAAGTMGFRSISRARSTNPARDFSTRLISGKARARRRQCSALRWECATRAGCCLAGMSHRFAPNFG